MKIKVGDRVVADGHNGTVKAIGSGPHVKNHVLVEYDVEINSGDGVLITDQWVQFNMVTCKHTMFDETRLSNTDYNGIDVIELFKAMKNSAWDIDSAMSCIGLGSMAYTDDGTRRLEEWMIADRLFTYILANNEDADITESDRDKFIADFPTLWDT